MPPYSMLTLLKNKLLLFPICLILRNKLFVYEATLVSKGYGFLNNQQLALTNSVLSVP